MVSVEWRPIALEALTHLDPVVKDRIVAKVAWLADNFESIAPEPLHRELRGLYKLRIGDHRVAYALTSRGMITIVMVGHRRDVYR
ncbi:type II toxin-antitoxin system RelE/ParE family toxin [Candidatus Kaiserbacteria bacterium]|nr:type II toxin-antitoxin system RelE/ParE family toxin [Candidatus Kaiserbacteria bacterium]